MNTHQLKHKLFIKGYIGLHTALHIGGTNSGMDIGGINASVVRDPYDQKPYIPGSSLKGKMRSLLEVANGHIGQTKMGVVRNGPSEDPTTQVEPRLFGYIKKKKGEAGSEQQPSRLIVRDAYMISPEEMFAQTDLPYTQLKTEVLIDRIDASANPRTIERVPRGGCFELEMVVNIYNEESEVEFMTNLLRAMELLEDDFLGGKGSRGCGQVDISLTSIERRSMEWYQTKPSERSDHNLIEEDSLRNWEIPGRLTSFAHAYLATANRLDEEGEVVS